MEGLKNGVMDAADPPLLEVPRPALAVVDEIGYGEASLSFGRFQEAAERPRTTVTRYLKHLTESWLVLRVRQGEYAIPRRSTFSRLLLEPSRYRRSVILYTDILDQRDERPHAFACLPIRSVYPMEIDRAIPVLGPDDRLKDTSRSPPYAEALWHTIDPDSLQTCTLEAGGEEATVELPCLTPERSLALLMASLDPRYMDAAEQAATRLDLDVGQIAKQAKRLSPTSPPLDTIRPNTVVFPRWLESFWETAKTQHANRALDAFLPEDDG